MSDLDSSSPRARDKLDETDGRRPAKETADVEARVGDPPQPTSHVDPSDVISVDDRTVISSEGPLPRQVPHDGLPPLELGRMLEGDQLGHYQLEEFVGGGGMGAVFRARDTMLDRTVAVKVLSSGHTSGEESRRRFQNEAQSAARLDHENIARVYYVGEDRGMHYIVFEYIEGINVRDLVHRDGPLGLSDAVDYTLQVAEALAHASLRDVVHRDIKPSNILITSLKRAKLVDMGLARLHQMERGEDDITASGMTLGTFDYISPEQARDSRSADVRSDLYSLGCTLYFMLTGRPPFPDGTMLQKLLQHQGDSAPDVRGLRAGLPEGISPILNRLLAKSPAKRYQKPEDLIADLLLLSRQMGLESSSSRSTVVLAPSRPADSLVRHTLPWLVPIAVLLLSVFGLYMTRSRGDASGVLPKFGSETDIQIEPSDTADRVLAPIVDSDSRSGSVANGEASANRPDRAESTRGDNGTARSPTDATPRLSSTPSEGSRSTVIGSNELRHPEALRPTADLARSDQTPVAGIDSPVIGDLFVGGNVRPRTYQSLSEAIAAARSGETIAVQFDELLVTRPIAIKNKRLTIRGPSGRWPRIVYRPDPQSNNANGGGQSLLTIDGGELRLENLEFSMELPDTTSRSVGGREWSLFSTKDADRLQIEKCWLTIRRPRSDDRFGGQSVEFIRVRGPSQSVSATIPGPLPPAGVEIHIEDCVARGRADFVVSDAGQSYRLTWRNGLLMTSERMMVVRSVSQNYYLNDLSSFYQPYSPGVEVDLQQLTAVAESGLLLVEPIRSAQRLPKTLPITLRCHDSILLTDPKSALIEIPGGDPASPRRQFVFHGDRNFYEGVKTFRRLAPLGLVSVDQDFDTWLQHWQQRDSEGDGSEINAHLYDVKWKQLPDADRPWESRVPVDYALDGVDAVDNPALRGASDGGQVGFREDRLRMPLKAPLPAIPENRNASTPSSSAIEGSSPTSGTNVERPASVPGD